MSEENNPKESSNSKVDALAAVAVLTLSLIHI